jgi:DNA polymerase III subunit beta
MKIEILREKLNQAIAIVSRVTIKSPNLPILEGIMIKADDNSVHFSATDLEMGIEVSVLSKVSKSGQAVVPTRILAPLSKLIGDEKLYLELNKNSLNIKDSENETSLQTMDSEEFPIIPKPEESMSTEIEGAVLSEGLRQVVNCVSSSRTRPEISGVYMNFSENQLTLAATDSYRLAQKVISLPTKIKKEREFILPAKAANNIIGIIGESNSLVKITGDENQLEFLTRIGDEPSSMEVRIVSRLIEGNYPRYQEVIPDKSPITIKVDRHEFLGKIRAASLLSDQTYEVKLIVSSEENNLKIKAQSSRIGEFKSSISAEVAGGDVEISFNGRFLSDALTNISGADVGLYLTDADKAVLIKQSEQPEYLYVLMPIRSS